MKGLGRIEPEAQERCRWWERERVYVREERERESERERVAVGERIRERGREREREGREDKLDITYLLEADF